MTAPMIIAADFHMHNWKAHSTMGGDGVNSRLQVGLDCLKQVGEHAKRVGAQDIIIAGDLFHVRGKLTPSVLTPVADALGALGANFQITLLAGNHDQENYNGGPTGLDTLDNIPGIRVVTKPVCLNLEGGQSVVFIPYFRSNDDFKNELIQMRDGALHRGIKVKAVVIHQGIDGISPSMPTISVDQKWFKDAWPNMPIFSGHYHESRRFNKLVNIGSPYQQTFGDEGFMNVCWMYDFDNEEISACLIDAPIFMTIDAKFSKWEKVKGNIIRAHAKTAAKGKLLCDRAIAVGAIDAIVLIEKEFTTAHSTPIAISSASKMFDDYIAANPKYSTNGARLKKLFSDICLT